MDWLLTLGTFGKVLQTVILIFAVIMIFNLMILVHEWGHFLAARWRGLYVDRFQIWFGKPIWKKTINGVQYGLGSIPAGGFVSLPQMAPMEAIEGSVQTETPLPPIKPIDKIIVAFAGPLFSFLLAAFFAVFVAWFGKPETEAMTTTTIGYVQTDSAAAKAGLQVGDKIISIDDAPIKRFNGFVDSVQWAVISSEGENINFKVERPGAGEILVPVKSSDAKVKEAPSSWFSGIFKRPPLKEIGIAGKSTPVVGMVQPNSPAEEGGLKIGDQLLSLEGQAIYNELQLIETVGKNGGKTLALQIKRDGKEQTLSVTPRLPDVRPENWEDPRLGFGFQGEGVITLAYPGVGEQLGMAARSIVNMIQKLASPSSEISAAHMSGPMGIGRVYYNLLQTPYPILQILWFSVVLNVNLAIMNLLPLPVLDGGHITMAIGEWIRRRPLKGRILEAIQSAFVLMLFGFLIFVTFKDVGDMFGGGRKRGNEPENAAPKIEWLPKAERP